MADVTLNVADGSTFGPGQKVLLGPFVATNLTTSTSGNVASMGGVVANPSTGPGDFVAMLPGRIIGHSMEQGTAWTAGVARYAIAINGTTTTKLVLVPTVAAGNLRTRAITAADSSTAISFVAGDRIGIRVKTGSAPATIESYNTLLLEM